ncbi:ABC transporter substrate-binding protein [Actinomyces radicidentis]|uniref:ABC transporter substrate-binding protein n=1 Tax=Actinomyces radicidentis TaxID=111015 RepID=A0A0X8JD08_ACTRD|nr:ABC transporter substrate-binding protein [Actinomyces radicidentis]AMD86321.1 ABC transporter substrate-binding protein [Actinomyces radicidentis]
MAISSSGATRRDFIRISSTLGLAAGIAATVAACGGSDSGSSSSGASAGASGGSTAAAPINTATPNADGVIKAGISYELGTNGYDPLTTSAALTVAANWHTMEGLTELHPVTREVYAALASDLPTKVDDKTYEATLRDGAKFSDGSAVTIDDVVFSFTRVLDAANESTYASFLPFLDSVTKKDDTTVTFALKYPFTLVAERLSVVKIVPKSIVEKDQTAFDQMPTGSGPYKMTDSGAGSQQIVFERNDSYNGPYPAKAKSMTWQILPDDTTRTNSITSGTVQAIDAVPASDLASMTSPLTVAAEQSFGLLFAMFNEKSLSDVKARQAIMYAIDYDKICNTGMSGLATAATCFVQKEHPAYKKAKTVYAYDADKAKSLAKEAGLTSVKLLATDHGWFSAVRPIIRENLEAIGLTVTYDEKKSADAYSLIDADTDGKQWDVLIAPGDPSVFGNDADLLMSWWYAADTWTDQRMHWKGTDSYTTFQTGLSKAAELTGDEQLTKWHELFDTLSEEVPLYPIFHRKTPTAYSLETLTNFQPIALTGLAFLEAGSTQA